MFRVIKDYTLKTIVIDHSKYFHDALFRDKDK